MTAETGINATLNIQNKTNFVLEKTFEDSYQIDNWKFPEKIQPNESVEVTVLLRNDKDIDLNKDYGKVRYRNSDNMAEIKILAHWLSFNFSSIGRELNVNPFGDVNIEEGKKTTLKIV